MPFHTQHTWSLFSQPRFLVNFRNQHSVWYFFLRILYYFTHTNRHIPACFSPSCSRLDFCGFHVILASLFWAYFSFSVSWLCKKNEKLTFGCFGNKICGWLMMTCSQKKRIYISFPFLISFLCKEREILLDQSSLHFISSALNVKDFLSVFLERIKFLCFPFCPFIFYF